MIKTGIPRTHLILCVLDSALRSEEHFKSVIKMMMTMGNTGSRLPWARSCAKSLTFNVSSSSQQTALKEGR